MSLSSTSHSVCEAGNIESIENLCDQRSNRSLIDLMIRCSFTESTMKAVCLVSFSSSIIWLLSVKYMNLRFEIKLEEIKNTMLLWTLTIECCFLLGLAMTSFWLRGLTLTYTLKESFSTSLAATALSEVMPLEDFCFLYEAPPYDDYRFPFIF